MGNSLEEWSKHLSKRTGKTFWYNKGTDERVWGDTPPQLQTGAAVNFQCTVSSHKKANNDGDTSAPVHTPISVDSESLGQKRTRHRASNNLPQRLQQEAASQVASISIINKEHLAPPPPAGSHLPTNRQRNNNTDPATDNSKQNPHLLTANDSNKQRNIPIQPQTYMNHRSSCHPQYPDEHRCSIITASNLPAQDISSPKQRANGKWRKQHNSSLSRTKRSAEHMDSWNNCERDKQRRIHHRESTATSFSLSTRAGDTVDNGTVDNGNGASSQIPCLEDGPSNPHLGQVVNLLWKYQAILLVHSGGSCLSLEDGMACVLCGPCTPVGFILIILFEYGCAGYRIIPSQTQNSTEIIPFIRWIPWMYSSLACCFIHR